MERWPQKGWKAESGRRWPLRINEPLGRGFARCKSFSLEGEFNILVLCSCFQETQLVTTIPKIFQHSQSPDRQIFPHIKREAYLPRVPLVALEACGLLRTFVPGLELRKTVLGIPLPVGEHRHIGDDKGLSSTLIGRSPKLRVGGSLVWGARWMLAPRKCPDELTAMLNFKVLSGCHTTPVYGRRENEEEDKQFSSNCI